MIREAEIRDKDQIYQLYRMLVPSSNNIEVLEEQVDALEPFDSDSSASIFREGRL